MVFWLSCSLNWLHWGIFFREKDIVSHKDMEKKKRKHKKEFFMLFPTQIFNCKSWTPSNKCFKWPKKLTIYKMRNILTKITSQVIFHNFCIHLFKSIFFLFLVYSSHAIVIKVCFVDYLAGRCGDFNLHWESPTTVAS